MAWSLKGTYLETCNCATACPCVFLSDPTEGECGALVGWHIDRGHDGEVSLDGLNVAFAVYSPGNMATTQWKIAVYLDDRANASQRESLTRIFGGQAGGHPAALAVHAGEVLGVEAVPMAFRQDGKRFTLTVGKVGAADIEPIEGQGGGGVSISGHPLAVAPGFAATVAKSREMSYRGHGMNWSERGKNAFFSPFSYQG